MAALFPTSLVIEQNTDFFFNTQWLDAAGLPIDLTGYTARFALEVPGGADALVVTTASGITLDAQGNIAVHLTNIQTSLAGGIYNAELDVTSAGGIITAILKGTIRLRKQI